MTTELKDIIDESYRLFAKYKAKKPLDICTACCATESQEDSLANLNLKEISVDLLAVYNNAARTEKTNIDEIKHFLPRYMDLIAQFSFPTHSTELSLDRLTPYDKSEWADKEYKLLSGFSEAFFRQCLLTYPIPSFSDSIDSVLIMFWKAKFDITQLLKVWEDFSSKESLLHFRDLLLFSFDEHNATKLRNAFAEKDLSKLLRDWIESDGVKKIFSDRIEKLMLDSDGLDKRDLDELSWTYELLKIKDSL